MTSVYLRTLALADLDRIARWHHDPALYRMLVGNFRPVNRSSVEEWLRARMAPSEHEVNLAICNAETSEHVGNVYLREIDRIAGRTELHIFIGDSSQRSKGFGQAAVRLALDHTFRQLGLRRVYLFVLADNLPAIHVYKKCGFIEEGRLRRHAVKEGEFKDVLVMGVLAEGGRLFSR